MADIDDDPEILPPDMMPSECLAAIREVVGKDVPTVDEFIAEMREEDDLPAVFETPVARTVKARFTADGEPPCRK